ncbi:hypothetical protein Ciccas_011853 [Cichlidogyrus casuarinus]|uniref:Uncharacterized protein n=1 Tax=Cichlidogyrus casuarinus TaxID=1844966 RepID=A0ABD2PRB1_9PLAT
MKKQNEAEHKDETAKGNHPNESKNHDGKNGHKPHLLHHKHKEKGEKDAEPKNDKHKQGLGKHSETEEQNVEQQPEAVKETAEEQSEPSKKNHSENEEKTGETETGDNGEPEVVSEQDSKPPGETQDPSPENEPEVVEQGPEVTTLEEATKEEEPVEEPEVKEQDKEDDDANKEPKKRDEAQDEEPPEKSPKPKSKTQYAHINVEEIVKICDEGIKSLGEIHYGKAYFEKLMEKLKELLNHTFQTCLCVCKDENVGTISDENMKNKLFKITKRYAEDTARLKKLLALCNKKSRYDNKAMVYKTVQTGIKNMTDDKKLLVGMYERYVKASLGKMKPKFHNCETEAFAKSLEECVDYEKSEDQKHHTKTIKKTPLEELNGMHLGDEPWKVPLINLRDQLKGIIQGCDNFEKDPAIKEVRRTQEKHMEKEVKDILGKVGLLTNQMAMCYEAKCWNNQFLNHEHMNEEYAKMHQELEKLIKEIKKSVSSEKAEEWFQNCSKNLGDKITGFKSRDNFQKLEEFAVAESEKWLKELVIRIMHGCARAIKSKEVEACSVRDTIREKLYKTLRLADKLAKEIMNDPAKETAEQIKEIEESVKEADKLYFCRITRSSLHEKYLQVEGLLHEAKYPRPAENLIDRVPTIKLEALDTVQEQSKTRIRPHQTC